MFNDFLCEDPAAFRARLEAANLPESVYDLLVETARNHGNAPAWHFIDANVKRTWSEVLDGVDAVATAFSSIGIGARSHVAVMSWNCEEFALAWLALARLQAVIVPLNAAYTASEVAHALSSSDSTFMIVEGEFLPLLPKTPLERIHPSRMVVIGDEPPPGAFRWGELLISTKGLPAPDVLRSRENVLNLQYTSGTTGFPKACMLTHDYWLVLATSSAEFFATDLRRLYLGSSLFYIVGQRILLNAMVLGGCVVIPRKPGAKRFMPDVAKYQCEYCALFEMVFKQPALPTDAQNSLKIATIFAFAPNHHRDFEQRFQVRGQEFYGMTEIGGATYMPASELERMSGSGSCGVLAPFRELKIVNQQGESVPVGETGELWARGRGMLKGYYRNPEADADAFSDGWFHTGDLARVDPLGFYYILGRIKDMVRRSGENISSREVECVLRSMPQIEDAAVLAVPDSYREEEVKAYVRLAPSHSKDDVDPETIVAYCRARLAAFKVPRYIEYRETFPLTDSQRVQKKVLRTEKPDLRVDAYDAQEKTWR